MATNPSLFMAAPYPHQIDARFPKQGPAWSALDPAVPAVHPQRPAARVQVLQQRDRHPPGGAQRLPGLAGREGLLQGCQYAHRLRRCRWAAAPRRRSVGSAVRFVRRPPVRGRPDRQRSRSRLLRGGERVLGSGAVPAGPSPPRPARARDARRSGRWTHHRCTPARRPRSDGVSRSRSGQRRQRRAGLATQPGVQRMVSGLLVDGRRQLSAASRRQSSGWISQSPSPGRRRSSPVGNPRAPVRLAGPPPGVAPARPAGGGVGVQRPVRSAARAAPRPGGAAAGGSASRTTRPGGHGVAARVAEHQPVAGLGGSGRRRVSRAVVPAERADPRRHGRGAQVHDELARAARTDRRR